MHSNASESLQPVFDFLDRLIWDHGDILFMVFAYAAIPFLIWVLCGGLRRKLEKHDPDAAWVTLIYLPLSPLIGGCQPPRCDPEDEGHWD